nr:alpha-isocomene synthase [Tanacetum cinerariifolium]
MKEYNGSYMEEAKWTHEEYTPTINEHTKFTVISSGYKFTPTASVAAKGNIITDATFRWVSTTPLVRTCCVLTRIMDDIVTHKERIHVASGIECYMKEFDETVGPYNWIKVSLIE